MAASEKNQNFLIGINKPSGITSHDVVNTCRKILGEKRIGHMGTLDPLATGVMLIGVGSAARLNQYLEAADKTYVVTAQFGKVTSTYDSEGEELRTGIVPPKIMEEKFVKQYLADWVGTYMQVPPPYSAIKVNGKPSYKAARMGEEVDLPAREVEIFSTELIELGTSSWTFEVSVSKGTYIRSLVHDIGQDLGCGAHVTALERTAIGDILLEDCRTVEQLEVDKYKNDIKILDAAQILGFPTIEADEKMMKRVNNGNSLRNDSKWNLFPGAKVSIITQSEKSNKQTESIERGLRGIYRMEDLHELPCECKFEGAIQLPEKEKYCATFGVFDGYHEGHAFEVDACIKDAQERGAKSKVFTFDIDPDELFVDNFKKLTTNNVRIDKLKKSGVDEVCVLNFEKIQNLSGEEFLTKFFRKNPPLSLHVGEGFRFGKNQSGDTDLLIKWGKAHGCEVAVHELLKKDGEVVSSTRLRESK